MRHALVTGASGFVGSYLVRELVERGVGVTATSRRRPSYLDKEKFAKVRFVSADIRDKDALKPALEQVDTVFHSAALFDFHAREKDLMATNADGSANLAELARAAGAKRFVNVSSAAVYGPEYGNSLAKETDAPRPVDKYARSKWEQEKRLVAFNSDAMKVVSLRPGAIYGPGSRYGDATAMWLIKRGLLFATPGLSKVISSHVHVKDVVGAAAWVALHDAPFDAAATDPARLAFNVADSSPVFNEELIARVAELIRKKGLLGYWRRVRLPAFLLKVSAYLAEAWATLTRTKPLFEVDSIDYITCPHGVSNERLLAAGYALRAPSITNEIEATIRWYEETDWRIFRDRDDELLYACVAG